MKIILYTQFGSHIYGTNVPTSDMDYKAIFIPEPKDILLQRAPGTIVQNTKENPNAKNTSNDVDIEMFSLHRYLDLLMQGQTVALDMLFTPHDFYKEGSSLWNTIQANKDRFLHKGTTAFVGYARQQAAKYGIKGTRIAALREALDFLQICEYTKLIQKQDEITTWVNQCNNEFIKIVVINGPNGKSEPHLDVCNRKIPFHADFKYARSVLQKIFDNYGERALQAERNEGVDWKALMHAVRVCGQAYELLTTGNITFPRPEADILLQIRKGELPYKEVAEEIEQGLEVLEKAKLASKLRETPDREFADSLIEDVYSDAVAGNYYPWVDSPIW